MALETVTPLTGKAEGVDMISSAWRHAAAHEPWDSGAVIVVARNSEGKDWDFRLSTRRLARLTTRRCPPSPWNPIRFRQASTAGYCSLTS